MGDESKATVELIAALEKAIRNDRVFLAGMGAFFVLGVGLIVFLVAVIVSLWLDGDWFFGVALGQFVIVQAWALLQGWRAIRRTKEQIALHGIELATCRESLNGH